MNAGRHPACTLGELPHHPCGSTCPSAAFCLGFSYSFFSLTFSVLFFFWVNESNFTVGQKEVSGGSPRPSGGRNKRLSQFLRSPPRATVRQHNAESLQAGQCPERAGTRETPSVEGGEGGLFNVQQ